MRRKNEGKDRRAETPRPVFTTSFKTGAIALVFMFLGFQLALFVREAAVDIIVAHKDRPDTVFVAVPESQTTGPVIAASHRQEGTLQPAEARQEGTLQPAEASREGNHLPAGTGKGGNHLPAGAVQGGRTLPATDSSDGASGTVRRDAGHSRKAIDLYQSSKVRTVETFPFDPNTVSLQDLQRLGFSEKQAASIVSYRNKGGRFHRKEDFAKSYVVADSVYARLKDHIVIPKLDINAADSAAFDALPGVGGWFAARMVEYRERIGGYSTTEQLLEIYNFGVERYEGLKDLITVGPKAQ